MKQIGEVSSGGYSLIFWMLQNPPDLLYSVIKGMAMATAIVDDLEHGARPFDRHDGLPDLLEGEPEGADRG